MTDGSQRLNWDLSDRELEAKLSEARNFGGTSPWRRARERLRADRVAWFSLRFLQLFLIVGLFAPLLPLPSPVAIDLDRALEAPALPWVQPGGPGFAEDGYKQDFWRLNRFDDALVRLRIKLFQEWQTGPWLGRDSMGRDVLARIVWGSRTSFVVALYATLVSLVIGVLYGALAGLLGGRADNLMMRLVDVLYSLPFVFLVIFVLSIVGARAAESRAGVDREKVLFVVIGAVWWLTMARVVRGQVLSLRESEFVQAARALGASTLRILFTHVLPNVLSVVVVYLTLTIPAILLFEAFLSFLGLGVEPPKVSWGILAVDGTDAINPLKIPWWIVVWPAVAMGSVLLALNLLGDGLRDALDPKRGAA
jgi:oligopeptide transport system permease protein